MSLRDHRAIDLEPRIGGDRRGDPADDAVLVREIELIWIATGEPDGVSRRTRLLQLQGFGVNHQRVGRIMRGLGNEGESGRHRVRSTIVDQGDRSRRSRPA
jgi:hypothetical protein